MKAALQLKVRRAAAVLHMGRSSALLCSTPAAIPQCIEQRQRRRRGKKQRGGALQNLTRVPGCRGRRPLHSCSTRWEPSLCSQVDVEENRREAGGGAEQAGGLQTPAGEQIARAPAQHQGVVGECRRR